MRIIPSGILQYPPKNSVVSGSPTSDSSRPGGTAPIAPPSAPAAAKPIRPALASRKTRAMRKAISPTIAAFPMSNLFPPRASHIGVLSGNKNTATIVAEIAQRSLGNSAPGGINRSSVIVRTNAKTNHTRVYFHGRRHSVVPRGKSTPTEAVASVAISKAHQSECFSPITNAMLPRNPPASAAIAPPPNVDSMFSANVSPVIGTVSMTVSESSGLNGM